VEETETTIIEAIKVPPPPRPPEPVPVEVIRPTVRLPIPIAQPTVDPPPIDITEPTEMDLPPAVVVADTTPTRTTSVTEPLAGAHLEYEIAPPPSYPGEAARAGIEGTVILRVLVGVDGKPLEVAVERSSGHRGLDLAARRQVLSKWRFKAAMQDGQSVQAIGLVPVVFRLDQ
jgi:protein TonB